MRTAGRLLLLALLTCSPTITIAIIGSFIAWKGWWPQIILPLYAAMVLSMPISLGVWAYNKKVKARINKYLEYS